MTWEKICKALTECCCTSVDTAPARQADNPPPVRAQTLVAGALGAGAAAPAAGAGHRYTDSTAIGIHSMLGEPRASAPVAGAAAPAAGVGHRYTDSTAIGIHSMLAEPGTDVPLTGATGEPTGALKP